MNVFGSSMLRAFIYGTDFLDVGRRREVAPFFVRRIAFRVCPSSKDVSPLGSAERLHATQYPTARRWIALAELQVVGLEDPARSGFVVRGNNVLLREPDNCIPKGLTVRLTPGDPFDSTHFSGFTTAYSYNLDMEIGHDQRPAATYQNMR